MKFNYQARDATGQTQVGVIEASSKDAALQLLSRSGLFVTIIEQESKERPFYAKRIAFFDRVAPKDLMLFSRELSIMFKSEVPLVEALRTIAVQTKNVTFREKLMQISEKVEGGTSLSEAMAGFPNVFSHYYVSIVKSGESSGALSEMLNSLADHLERDYALNSKIKGALTYPAFVVFIGLAVMFLTMFFVIPNLTKVLSDSHAKLPLATQIVIGSANFLRAWWLVLFGGIAGAIIGIRQYLRTPAGKRVFDLSILKVPTIGSFLKMVSLSRFAENLSTLISGGLPIVEALQITENVVGNEVYKDIIEKAKEAVASGKSISEILQQYPSEVPPLFTQMVLVGEKSGTLETTLLDIVQFYQREVASTVDSLVSILEPVLIVVLGLLVGGMMAAVLLPLYQSVSF